MKEKPKRKNDDMRSRRRNMMIGIGLVVMMLVCLAFVVMFSIARIERQVDLMATASDIAILVDESRWTEHAETQQAITVTASP